MTELYIENKKVDTNNEDVKMLLESNVFGGIGDITSNRTYTISLPHSLNNDRIFEQAGIPTIKSGIVRRYLKARYIIDGVELISRGKAVVLSVDEDKYQITLIWGICDYLGGMKDGKKLREFNDDTDKYNTLYVVQDSSTTASTGMELQENGIGYYSVYNQPKITDGNYPLRLPAVSVGYVLGVIKDRYGVDIDWSDKAQEKINRMYLCLHSARYCTDNKLPTAKVALTPLSGTYSFNVQTLRNDYGLLNTLNGQQVGGFFDITINGVLQLKSTKAFTIKTDLGDFKAERSYYDGYYWWYTADVTYQDFKIEKNSFLKLTTDVLTDGISGTFEFTIQASGDLAVGCGYPIIPNLPDLTAIEFITEVAMQTATFPMVIGGKVKFVSVEDILSNEMQDVEIIGNPTIEFTYGDYAKHNYISYKDRVLHKGDIEVEDSTLEDEQALYESALGGSPIIYSDIEKDEGTGLYKPNKINDCEASLNIVYNGMERFAIVGSIPLWDDTIKDYWQGYQDIIRRPLVVTAKVRLKPWELKKLRMDAPVYSKKLGQRYILISINNDSTDFYTIKMIKA